MKSKKIKLETMPKNKVGDLDAQFVDNAEKEKKPRDEYPPVGFFSLYRYSTALDKFLLFIGVLCVFGTAAVAPLNMLLFGNLTGDLIDFAVAKNTPGATTETIDAAKVKLEDKVQEFAIYNTSLGVLMLTLSYISTTLFNYSGLRQSFKIRTLYLKQVLHQDIAWYDVHQSGDFASRMTDDLLKLEEGLGEKVAMFIHFMASFVGSLALALIKGWELALICLISLPVTMISMGVVAYLTSKLAKNEMDAYGAAGGIAEEVLGAIKTVLAFGGQSKETTRYEKNLVFARNNNIKRSLLSGIGFGILWFCIYGAYALSFWYGVGLVIKETEENVDPADRVYGPSNMVTVFFSVMTGSMNFGMSSPYIEVFGVAKGAASKIFGVIDSKPTIAAAKETGDHVEKVQRNIEFKNIRFNYPSRKEVNILQGLNLTIKKGETVALVGSSGCGKSTVVQLMQRFYDPDSGEVLLDGKNLKDLNLTSLRKIIGVVGQEPVLFGTTIGENIRYGLMNSSQEDIERAARKANAHKFITALPQGYNTIVGERGAQLSGGQKQRIAIARALVREPSILLLDEATSALDTNSEAKVQKALDDASKECTTIIVAHRLSTIRGADRIVVIKNGVAVEEGSHDELMQMENGEYHKLVMTQVHGFEEDDDDGKRVSIMNDEDDNMISEHHDLEATEEVDEDTSKISILTILRLNRPERPQIVLGVLASLIMGFATPVFAILFGDIIGILQESDTAYVRSESNIYCIYFVIAGIVTGFSTFIQIYMFGNAGEKMVMRVRSRMFDTFLKQEIGWYDRKENGVGALCAKLSSEAANLQGATGQRIGTVVQSVATLLLSVGLSMYYEWKLGLVALAFTPIILGAVFFQSRMMMSENEGYRKSLEKSTKLAVEAVGNIRTVLSLGCEKTFHEIYVMELTPFIKTAKRNTHFRALVLGLARSIMFFAFTACMYYGAYLIREDNMGYDVVLKVSQALIMGTVSIANALAFAPNFQKGITAAAKIFNLFNRVPKIGNAPMATSKAWKNGNINYSEVIFAYPTRPDTMVLQGLDLNILNGKTVALVGPSGCGKSTIIQLIERYYDPKSGSVDVDGEDLRLMKLESLRSNLGIVSQEPNLFDRTIAENIAYGDNSREVSQDEVIQAAKNANIHNFIVKLPLGYETPLGEKGTQLSGGQKQRVAIARALVRNPKVLLLDEATSALDVESEKIVQEALDQAKTGRTCITIAHRLTTIQDADVICVVNEGKVIEIGKHAELLAIKGLYHKLHKLQSGAK